MKKITHITLLLLLVSLSVVAQDMTGYWQGVLYQGSPPFANYYPFSMTLNQTGNTINGTSEIRFYNEYGDYGIMALNGTFNNPNFTFTETSIIDENITGSYTWCIKTGTLIYDDTEKKLEGAWSSTTGGCSPGTIVLYRLEVISDTVFCEGEPVALEVSGQAVRWYADEGLNSLLHTGNTYTPNITASTTYYVTQTFGSYENTQAPPIRINVSISSPNITNVATTDATCQNAAGNINITASGGTSPLEYSIDGTIFQTSNIFNNVSAGTYTTTVRDSNGCTDTQSATILSSGGTLTISDIATTNSACNTSNGTITITANGTGVLQYSIDGATFQNSNVFSNLPAATYTVIVKDNGGCTSTQTAQVISTTPLGFLRGN